MFVALRSRGSTMYLFLDRTIDWRLIDWFIIYVISSCFNISNYAIAFSNHLFPLRWLLSINLLHHFFISTLCWSDIRELICYFFNNFSKIPAFTRPPVQSEPPQLPDFTRPSIQRPPVVPSLAPRDPVIVDQTTLPTVTKVAVDLSSESEFDWFSG